jgi:hypothetical protein
MMRTEEIHEMITSEFPAHPFYGTVTEKWHPPSFYESEGDDLTTLLKGKTWRDLYPDYVDVNEDDYVLMNASALPIFFAAWLWRAAEDLGSHNQIRSSLIFHLATFGNELWRSAFKSLNQRQREVIRILLESSAPSADEKEKSLIEKALGSIDASSLR